MSSLLKILVLLPMSPDHDRGLPAFVAKLIELSPQHAELCTRGRQIQARLPAYLEQQRDLVRTHVPVDLEPIVAA
jgi:hypothetical protein